MKLGTTTAYLKNVAQGRRLEKDHRQDKGDKVMRVAASAVFILAAFAAAPASAECKEDNVKMILDDGGTVVLMSGKSFDSLRVMDAVDAGGWHPGDEVLVCDSTISDAHETYNYNTIINKSKKDEQINTVPSTEP